MSTETGTPSVTALGSDVVSLTGTASGTFSDKNVGTGKTLSVSGYTVNDGNGGGNYIVTAVPNTTGAADPQAFALVGMGALLAAASHAPVMAIIMLFELTLNYQILMPIMLAGVISYYVSRSLTSRSLYGEALKRKGQVAVTEYLVKLKVGDLMSQTNVPIDAYAGFGEVVRTFLQSRRDFLMVVENGRFAGTISLHDIKPYLDQPDLESLLIAKDVMREEACALGSGQTMGEALHVFGRAETECLPVLDADRRFLGSVTKTDVLLFLAGTSKQQEV